MSQERADELKVEPAAAITGYEAFQRHLKIGAGMLDRELTERLIRDYPEYTEILTTAGRKLGAASRSSASVVEIWSVMLSSGARRCRSVSREVQSKLKRADGLELVSELVAAASSSAL